MIRFTLRCNNDHEFDSWFQSGPAYETLRATGLVNCAICGSAEVQKALMAPQVRPARNAVDCGTPGITPEPAPPPVPTTLGPTTLGTRPLAAPGSALEAMLGEMRRKIEETSDYVGADFASEARRIHEGDAPHRSIFGEADADEARSLMEDGIPVAALPWMPKRNTN